MGLWNTVSTIFKAKKNNADEALQDANAVDILTQHIREAKSEMQTADQNLVKIIADRKLADEKVKEINASVEKYTNHAVAANEKGNQELALECASKVQSLRNDLDGAKERQNFYVTQEGNMRRNVQEAKDRLAHLESQVDIVKANEAVQQAQAATLSSVSGAGSKVSTAMDSLSRIQEQQKKKQAQMDAANELATAPSSLDDRLNEAGVTGGSASAEDELARILGGN